MAEEFAHKALAEAHDFHIALALRIEIRAAFAAAHGKAGQGVFENLLEAQEFDDAQVDGRVQSQAALIRPNCAVELHSHATVHLHFALIIHPRNAENDLALGLNNALQNAGSFVFRLLLENRLQRFQDFLHCLQKFRLIRVLCLDGFINSLCVRHVLFLLHSPLHLNYKLNMTLIIAKI